MLEGVVSNILSRYLTQYIANVNPNSLKIAVWQGDTHLERLQLRPEALDAYHMPIRIAHGYIGKLLIHIPWSRLQSSPVIIDVEDVYVVMRPKRANEVDPEVQKQQELELKRRQLEAHELMEQEKATGADTNNTGFLSQFTQTIINNIQVKVHNVHIRYEDDTSTATKPFAAGITLREIAIRSTDEHWNYGFFALQQEQIYKLSELNKFAFYINREPRESFISNRPGPPLSFDELSAIMHSTMFAKTNDYILQPISGRLKLKMQKEGRIDTSQPRIWADVAFDTVAGFLNDEQFRDALVTLNFLMNYKQLYKFRRLRPSVPVMQDPRSWWKYVGECLLMVIRERHQRISWKQLFHRRQQRWQYVKLYKRAQGFSWHRPLSERGRHKLEELEDQLELDDILLFRKFALRELQEEVKMNPERLAEYKAKTRIERPAKAQAGGWRWFSSVINSVSGWFRNLVPLLTGGSSSSSSSSGGQQSASTRVVRPDDREARERERGSDAVAEDVEREREEAALMFTNPPPSPSLSPSHMHLGGLPPRRDHHRRRRRRRDTEVSEEGQHEFLMTSKQQQELYDSIGYSPTQTQEAQPLPDDFVEIALGFNLRRGSLTLIDASTDMELVETSHRKLAVRFDYLHNSSFKLVAKLGNLSIIDRHNAETTQFPMILRRKPTLTQPPPPTPTPEEETLTSRSQQQQQQQQQTKTQRAKDDDGELLLITIRKNPPDSKTSMAFEMVLMPLEFVLNLKLTQCVVDFFTPPQQVNFDYLARATMTQLDAFTKKALRQLTVAIQSRTTVDLNILIHAPNVFVPTDPDNPRTNVLVADLGTLTMISNIDDRIRRQRVAEDMRLTVADFYDRYVLTIRDARALVVSADMNQRLNNK